MTAIPFEGATPSRALYVSVGSGSGNGSKASPYHSVQQAVNAATPGTIIYVEPGTYHENIKIAKNSGGTSAAPVWLVSQGGPGTAEIIAATSSKPVIQALGVDNYVIKDLTLSGGYDGIQFSQSGRNFTNLVNNIVLENNTIKDSLQDGIKIGQANNVYVGGNTIDGVKNEEGIDFTAVVNGTIVGNEVSNDHGTTAGIFAKGGSTHIQILDNYVHNVSGDGISAGGWTDASAFRPGFTAYEAKDVLVSGNQIEAVGKRPVSVRGATGVSVTDNFLHANSKYADGVYISTGNPKAAHVAYSSDVHVTDNVLSGVKTVVKIDAGNSAGFSQSGNASGVWHDVTGPASLVGGHASAALATVSDVAVGGSSVASVAAAAPTASTEHDASTPSLDAVDTNDSASYAAAQSGVRANLLTPSANLGAALGADYANVHSLVGSAFNDTLTGDNSSNTLFGGTGNDHISGLGGADIMSGGAGDDVLSGNGGNDHLDGGVGNDTLSGGTGGKDWFVYSSHDWGHDVITDFESKLDLIDFRGSGENFADLHLSQQGADVLITNADHSSSIVIDNMQVGHISASDFVFG